MRDALFLLVFRYTVSGVSDMIEDALFLLAAYCTVLEHAGFRDPLIRGAILRELWQQKSCFLVFEQSFKFFLLAFSYVWLLFSSY